MGQTQSNAQGDSFFKLNPKDNQALLVKYIDLAAGSKGGKVLESSDEFLGQSASLIKKEPAVKATSERKDGWETRRHNKYTHHSATIQLACPGNVVGFDFDTTFFDGDHPEYASVEGCFVIEGTKPADYKWEEMLPRIPLKGNAHHYYGLEASDVTYTHVRLNVFPDGGLARFRVFGVVSPVFPEKNVTLNLASMANGALIVKSSDGEQGEDPFNLLLPFPGKSARDGWRTKRSRDPFHRDWVDIKLGDYGLLEAIEVDTTHFDGQHPDYVSFDACNSEYHDVRYDPNVKWHNLLPQSAVFGDKKNHYKLRATGHLYSHVRLNIFPDGGLSRIRIFGVRVSDMSRVMALESVEELQVIEPSPLKVSATKSKTTIPLDGQGSPAISFSSSATLTEDTFKSPSTPQGRRYSSGSRNGKASGNVALAEPYPQGLSEMALDTGDVSIHIDQSPRRLSRSPLSPASFPSRAPIATFGKRRASDRSGSLEMEMEMETETPLQGSSSQDLAGIQTMHQRPSKRIRD